MKEKKTKKQKGRDREIVMQYRKQQIYERKGGKNERERVEMHREVKINIVIKSKLISLWSKLTMKKG